MDLKPESCVDCAHHRAHEHFLSHVCDRRVIGHKDIVTGENTSTMVVECYFERRNGWILSRLTGKCGKEGRFFEAKVPVVPVHDKPDTAPPPQPNSEEVEKLKAKLYAMGFKKPGVEI